METTSIICVIPSMAEENRNKLKKKVQLLTNEVSFLDSIDVSYLRTFIASQSGFVILLVDCDSFPDVSTTRNAVDETMPIYTHCSHPTATRCSEDLYLKKVM